MRYSRIIDAVLDQPLLMRPEKVEAVVEVLRTRAVSDIRLTAEEIESRLGAAPVRKSARRTGAVAVLPLYGIIAQRMNLVQMASGGTSTQQFAGAFRQALEDPDVNAILIDVDSPGGSVFGVEELSKEIYEARGKKPIWAIANSEAASAAYWIASSAEKFYITPSGWVGSIGVVTVHEDFSKADEMAGIKVTIITAGKYKAEGNPYEPLSDDALDYMQGIANDYFGVFTAAVARNRGVSTAMVRSDFGQGRMVRAKPAKAAGMVDGIATFEQVLSRLGGNAEVMDSATPADPSMMPGGETDIREPEAQIEETSAAGRRRSERLMEIALAGGR